MLLNLLVTRCVMGMHVSITEPNCSCVVSCMFDGGTMEF